MTKLQSFKQIRIATIATLIGVPLIMGSTLLTPVFAATTANSETVQSIIQKADGDISIRLTSLNKLITNINLRKELSTDQKTFLVSDMNTNISGLNTLKTKIDSDTELKTAKTDRESIFTQFRIYAVVLPKNNAIANGKSEQTIISKYQSLSTTLKAAIDKKRSAGKDVTAVMALWTDMNTKLNEALKNAQSAISIANTLTASGFNSNKTGVKAQETTMYEDTKASRDNIKAAHNDAKTIRLDLKTL